MEGGRFSCCLFLWSYCAIACVVVSGITLAGVIGTELTEGKAELFTKTGDKWCHMLATRPVEVVPGGPWNPSFNHTFVDLDFGVLNLASLQYNQAGHHLVNTSFMKMGQKPQLRCSPEGAVLTDSTFEKAVFMTENWSLLMSIAIGGWGLVLVTKTFLLKPWVEVIRSRHYGCVWTTWVIFDAYIHMTLLPTLLLLPLTSLVPTDSPEHLFALNVNWPMWVVTVCMVALGFVRLIVYITCPCTDVSHPEHPILARCHSGLVIGSVLTVGFLLVAMVDLSVNVSYSSMFLIDLAVVLKVDFELNPGVELFAQIFQKSMLNNLIVQHVVVLINFCLKPCREDRREQQYDVEAKGLYGSGAEHDYHDGFDDHHDYEDHEDASCFGGGSQDRGGYNQGQYGSYNQNQYGGYGGNQSQSGTGHFHC